MQDFYVCNHLGLLYCRQWLPAEKIEPLGTSIDYDFHKIAHSGHSKRSVKEAYNRAKQYQKRVARKAASLNDSKKYPDTGSKETSLSENDIGMSNVEVL